MSETIDDLTIAFEDDGVEVTRELGKVVLSKGAWSTIAYLYQDLDGRTGEYGPQKITLRRYQKQRGAYRQKSKFNISSIEQARKIRAALDAWIDAADAQK